MLSRSPRRLTDAFLPFLAGLGKPYVILRASFLVPANYTKLVVEYDRRVATPGTLARIERLLVPVSGAPD